MTHGPVAVAHGAGLALAQVEEVVTRLLKWRAGSVFPPAAHFTRVFRFWRRDVVVHYILLTKTLLTATPSQTSRVP